MDRSLQNTDYTFNGGVTVDEVGTDPSPDSATVTITRADGAPVVTGATAVNGLNGGFSYTLVPAQTALLDTLTAVWTFTLNGRLQSLKDRVEIVGGYHFGLDQLRRLPGLADQNAFSTAKLIEARTLAETVIEHACGRAFVPRYRYERIDSFAELPQDIRAVRSAVNTDGTVLDSTQLLDAFSGWYPYHSYSRRNRSWTVGIEHGMDACPVDVSRASMLLARSFLIGSTNAGSGSFDERATSVTYADAGLSYSLVTASVRGAATSLPEVNAVIDRYRVVAFA